MHKTAHKEMGLMKYSFVHCFQVAQLLQIQKNLVFSTKPCIKEVLCLKFQPCLTRTYSTISSFSGEKGVVHPWFFMCATLLVVFSSYSSNFWDITVTNFFKCTNYFLPLIWFSLFSAKRKNTSSSVSLMFLILIFQAF